MSTGCVSPRPTPLCRNERSHRLVAGPPALQRERHGRRAHGQERQHHAEQQVLAHVDAQPLGVVAPDPRLGGDDPGEHRPAPQPPPRVRPVPATGSQPPDAHDVGPRGRSEHDERGRIELPVGEHVDERHVGHEPTLRAPTVAASARSPAGAV